MRDWIAPDTLALHARARPQKLACVDLATGRRWTYQEFDKTVERAVSTLADRFGIVEGQRVAVLARNSADLLILQQATMRLGAIFVPLNWRLSPNEQERILRDCSPTLLVTDLAVACEAAPDGRIVAWPDLLAAIESASPGSRTRSAQSADTPCIILYTSGTSGTPKGVILTCANVFFTAVNTSVLGHVSSNSVFLGDAPMFHVIGLVTTIQAPLLHGGTIMISPGFDPVATNERLADSDLGVTHYFCVPQMADALRYTEDFRPERWKLEALFTGGAPNPPASIRWWLSQGVRMVDGFGMTEIGTTLGMPIDEEIISAKAGSVGLPAPATNVRLIDDDGCDVPDGKPGEVIVSGPNVSPGYWGRPAETAQSFTSQGWLRTGDIGCRDEDGFFYIVDRRKDMYISGGENVYPAEVEAVLIEHEAVRDAAVIGVADPKWGEVGRAFIVLKPDWSIDVLELAEYCSARIARYKVPKEFRIVDALPRTASGKVKKDVLREPTPLALR